jgi:hypothetical protein
VLGSLCHALKNSSFKQVSQDKYFKSLRRAPGRSRHGSFSRELSVTACPALLHFGPEIMRSEQHELHQTAPWQQAIIMTDVVDEFSSLVDLHTPVILPSVLRAKINSQNRE